MIRFARVFLPAALLFLFAVGVAGAAAPASLEAVGVQLAAEEQRRIAAAEAEKHQEWNVG